MNIGLYLKIFPPFEEGLSCGYGIVKAVHVSAKGLAACGADVTVLCEGPEEHRRRADAGYTVQCFSNTSWPLAFRAGNGLAQYLESPARPDLVILNGIFDPSVYAVSRQLKKHRIPYVAAPHDPYHPAIFGTNAHLKWPYWYLVERRMLAGAEAVQVLDARHEQWLRRLSIKTPVIEVTNGFVLEDLLKDMQEDLPAKHDLRRSEDGPAHFFFLGRIDAYNKGLDLLVDAYAQMERPEESRLIMQGPDDTGDKAVLEAKARALSLSGPISVLPPDFAASSASLIARHDVLCMPSRFEGFGLSALEAMLAARVVMVSEMAGIAPHVRASDCGVVVEPDVRSVREGLEELLRRRPEWEEMGLRGRRHVIEHLRHDGVAADALAHYQDIISHQRMPEMLGVLQ